MKLQFTKMQAQGNDYIYMDAIHQVIENPSRLARKVSDRHFGIGSDGLVLICPSKGADFRMRIFNPDGTEAEMCGNALRSTGKFVYFHGLTSKNELEIETLGGIKKVWLNVREGRVENIRAYIGMPEFSPEKIPVIAEGEVFLDRPLQVADRMFRASALSWGIPCGIVCGGCVHAGSGEVWQIGGTYEMLSQTYQCDICPDSGQHTYPHP